MWNSSSIDMLCNGQMNPLQIKLTDSCQGPVTHFTHEGLLCGNNPNFTAPSPTAANVPVAGAVEMYTRLSVLGNEMSTLACQRLPS